MSRNLTITEALSHPAIQAAMREGRCTISGVRSPVSTAPREFASESAFQSAVVQLARDYGWLVYHTFNSRRSEPGFPDTVLIRDGVLVVAELKMPGNKPPEAQRNWLRAFERAGAKTFLWYPSDWNQIVEVLR